MSAFTFLDQLYRKSRNTYHAARGRRRVRKNPEYWQQFPDRVLNEAPCTFVLSTGRCGTRMLTTVLHHCGNVDVNHHAELADELQFPSRVAFEAGPQSGAEFEHAALFSRFETIQTSFLNDRQFVETNNRATFLAPAFHNVFKSSRFIHLVRDPGSFVRSCFDYGWYTGTYYDSGRLVPIAEPHKSMWPKMERIRKLAWLWNATNEFIEQFKKNVEADRILEVRSEEFFKDVGVVERVLDFAGANSLSHRKLARLFSRPVNAKPSGGRPPFKQWSEGEKQLVWNECPLAETYGYTNPKSGLRAA